jgi:hypothetical protein
MLACEDKSRQRERQRGRAKGRQFSEPAEICGVGFPLAQPFPRRQNAGGKMPQREPISQPMTDGSRARAKRMKRQRKGR